MSERFGLLLCNPARRALESRLPLSVTFAVWEFCNGVLRDAPRRVGRPLGRELAGYFSAHRGAYRIIYRIDDDAPIIHVVRIEHRAVVYRPR
ncbi:MAG: type II toxin-antitoxin system RelE family toxin [Mycobacterium sp.]